MTVSLTYQAVFAGQAGWPSLTEPAGLTVGYGLHSVVQLGTLLGIWWLCVRMLGGAAPLGWRAPRVLRQVAAAAVALISFAPVYFATYALARLGFHLLDTAPVLQAPVQAALDSLDDPARFAMVAFVAVVVAPLFEEVLFRGVLVGGLVAHVGPAPAAVASAIAFALVHLNPLPLMPLYALGVLLAGLRLRTGSLVAPIVCHALFNALQLALMVWGR